MAFKNTLGLSDAEQEHYRVLAFRTFRVYVGGESLAQVPHTDVIAHSWSCEGGDLCFFTIGPTGRQTIRDAFARGTWTRLKEVTDPKREAEIDSAAKQLLGEGVDASRYFTKETKETIN